MNKSKRICELLGIDYYSYETKGVDGEVYAHSIPSFDNDAGRVNLLRLMMTRENWDEFSKNIGIESYDGYYIKGEYITIDGPLIDACIEWLEKEVK